jgi:hypothetical protein
VSKRLRAFIDNFIPKLLLGRSARSLATKMPGAEEPYGVVPVLVIVVILTSKP